MASQKSLEQMENIVLANVRFPDDLSMRERARDWLNEIVDEATRVVSIPSLQDEFTFTLLRGVGRQQLPTDTAWVINARVTDRNGDIGFARELDDWDKAQFDAVRPTSTALWEATANASRAQGTPSMYRVRKIDGIIADRVGTIENYYAHSTDNSDTANVSMVAYLDANRQTTDNFTVALQGTARVKLGSAFAAIAFSKNGDTKGTVIFEKLVSQQPVLSSPTFKSVATAASSGRTSSITVSVPAGVVDGDRLIMVIESSYEPGVDQLYVGFNIPVGWTEVGKLPTYSNGSVVDIFGILVLQRVASSEPASYTFTIGGSRNLTASILAYTPASDVQIPNVNLPFGGNILQGAITPAGKTSSFSGPTNVDDTVIVMVAHVNSTVTFNADPNWVERADFQSSGGGIHTQGVFDFTVPTAGNVFVDGVLTTGVVAQKYLITTWFLLIPGTTIVQLWGSPIAIIGPREIESQLFEIEVNPLTDNTFGFAVRFQRRAPRMIHKSDTAWFIPAAFNRMIIEGAIAKGEHFIVDERVLAAKAEYKDMKEEFLRIFRAIRPRKIGMTWEV